MKLNIIAIIIVFSCQNINSQNLDKKYYQFNADTIDLSTNEKVLQHKQLIINCMDYMLSHKSSNISNANLNCFDLILNLNDNPTYNVFNLDAYPVKLTKGGSMSYAAIYWAGLTKLKLEQPELLNNDTLLAFKSIELFVDYYMNPKNKIRLSKERKYVANLRSEQNLDVYVEQLFIETALRKSKQKP